MSQQSSQNHPSPWLTDVTSSAGVSFKHLSGASGELRIPEVIGSGVGILDFDGDGWLDIWFVQSGYLRDDDKQKNNDALYKNVSKKSGILQFEFAANANTHLANRYGMGITILDFDLDSDPDVFLTNFGNNQLLANDNGSFVDVSQIADIEDDHWSVSAASLDYDNDGLQDLYVANYIDYTHATHRVCHGITAVPDYCTPNSYNPVPDQLLRNLGNGKFQDVTKDLDLHTSLGNSLGVIALDADNNGLVDMYVANDATPNHLWLQQSNGKFNESASRYGVAVNEHGKSEAGMGIATTDIDGDCHNDLVVTNLAGETHTLYQRRKGNWFSDRTNRYGLGTSSFPDTGFGVATLDLDGDGWDDLIAVNGGVSLNVGNPQDTKDPLAQPNKVWLNHKGELTVACDSAFCRDARNSRGLATADLDNDGDLDLVVSNNGGKAQIFRNDLNPDHWVGVEIQINGSTVSNGRVAIRKSGSGCQWKEPRTDGSYASAGDHRVVFLLDSPTEETSLEILLDSSKSILTDKLAPNRYHTIELPSD